MWRVLRQARSDRDGLTRKFDKEVGWRPPVNGGRLYGTFPDQALNNAISFSRGQTIPSTSVDQMAATLARWMGVTSSTDLATIFPNLINFPTSNLGFMA